MAAYQSEKSPARLLFVGGAMLVLVVAIGAIALRSQKSKAPEPSIAVFRQEVSALQLPPGVTLVSPTQESARIGSVTLTNRYSVPQGGGDARATFHTALAARGWTFKIGSDGAPWSDTYCKPPLAAKVDLVEERDGTSMVSLALSWNELALLTCGSVPAAGRS